MSKINDLYPRLSWDHVRALALLVATERNAVAKINQVYKRSTWGIACLCCQVARDKVRDVAGSDEYSWLRYVPEKGLAYTVVVGGVPMRIQPDVDEIRAVMPGERLMIQETLFAIDDGTILRLEVSQAHGEQVTEVALYLFEESSGITLDRQSVYTSSPSAVTPLARPAQDVSLDDLFAFQGEDREEKRNDSA